MGAAAGVRSLFADLGYYAVGAGLFLLVAVLGLLVVLQSPDDMLLWTGTKVAGVEQGGVVTYHWDNASYSFAVPGVGSKPHETVYINPANPSHGVTNSVGNRVLDGLFTAAPLATGIVIIVIGVWRRRRDGRTRTAVPAGFGRGLDPATVERLLAQGRRPPPT